MTTKYKVGYRKPPKEKQFMKGQSGNPAGRPKGSKGMATLFNQITRELIDVTENGRTKTMTRLEAILRQIINKALSGDHRVMREFVQWSRIFEEAEKNEPDILETSERDEAILSSLIKRLTSKPKHNKDKAKPVGPKNVKGSAR